MAVKIMLKSVMVAAGTTAMIVGCSGGGGSSPSTENPLANLGTEITTHMSSAIPSTSSVASTGLVSPKVVAAWDSANADLKKPGCTQGGQSLKQFALDLLDSDYQCDDGNGGSYTPSVFGRFSMTMMVLKVIGDNIVFENGAPKVGTHEFTEDVPVEGGTFPIDFDVTVAAVTSDHFDVKIQVVGTAGGQTLISGNTIYFKNRSNQTNIMALEDNGSDRVSWDVLYWNRSTGAMSYTYASRNADVSVDAAEVQKIVIEGTGAPTRVGHYMVNAGDNVFFTADFANAAASTEATVAFEQSGSHVIDATVYCVNVADLSEKAAAACGSASGISGWKTGADISAKNYAQTKALFGADEAAWLANTPDFSTSSFNTID